MPLAKGTKLGQYEILSLIGVGGMGEVYHAYDTDLRREVALKVLPEQFARDPGRVARFKREAHVLASLNHPNIAAIHGMGESAGRHFLVMELVLGDTLRDRITRDGPSPVEETLTIGKQIAEALEHAHEKPIVHRDLKPANIKVTPEGQVKVLDFGLAKAFSEAESQVDIENAPTLSASPTIPGTILGTPAYMSPEQAKGKKVDKRTDVWAFGCVLYELLTAKQAFQGENVTEVLAAILKGEPDWQALPAATPSKVRELLRRCLQKDKTMRLRDAGDARLDLHDALSAPSVAAPTSVPQIASWRWAAILSVASLLLGGFIAGVFLWNLRRSETPAAHPPKRFALSLPQTDQLVNEGLALSPDGKTLVYVGRRARLEQLYRRSMDQFEASPIPGPEGARWAFFSPDGQWVGFFADGRLKKVPVGGGPPVALCPVRGSHRGASWGPDDMIVFAVAGSGLQRVPAAGGNPEPLTTIGKDEVQHMWPDILPGGQAVLFNILGGVGGAGGLQVAIVVQSLKTGQRKLLLEGANPRFASTGHIVFARAGSLWAVPFDADRLQVTSSPAPVGEGLQMDPFWFAHFALARDGSLVYIPGTAFPARRLVWVDRKGMAQPLSAPLRTYETPRLSPDGQRLAVEVREENSDVWTLDLARGSLTRLTFEPGEDEMPVWMPDGKRLVFAGDRAGVRKLLSKLGDGSGTEEELLGSRGGHRHSDSVSPKGQVLAFDENSSGTGTDIWMMSLQGDRKPSPFLQTPFTEQAAAFSPDGRWIAYVSNESGRNEVYVQAYPDPGGKWQISTEGGQEPVWARGGRELFYRNGDKMMAVDVTTQPTFNAGSPHVLFEGPYESVPWSVTNYDATADGQRFLMIQPVEPTTSQIHVVLNWFEELKRRVPSGQ